MKKWLVFLICTMSLLIGTSTYASPVVTWGYSVSGIFTDTAFENDGNSFNDCTLATTTKLAWGVRADGAAGGSSLVISDSPAIGQVDTYLGGGSVPVANQADSISLTHNNWTLNANTGSLLSTTLLVTVGLDPFDPDNSALGNQAFSFRINFKETTNSGSYQNDVFALIDGFPNFNFYYDSITGAFSITDSSIGDTYFVNVFPTDDTVLSVLDEAYAGLAGVPTGTMGFTTEEGKATTLGFSFTISTEPLTSPIPEPATFLLLGFGLLGFAGVSRRKK